MRYFLGRNPLLTQSSNVIQFENYIYHLTVTQNFWNREKCQIIYGFANNDVIKLHNFFFPKQILYILCKNDELNYFYRSTRQKFKESKKSLVKYP